MAALQAQLARKKKKRRSLGKTLKKVCLPGWLAGWMGRVGGQCTLGGRAQAKHSAPKLMPGWPAVRHLPSNGVGVRGMLEMDGVGGQCRLYREKVGGWGGTESQQAGSPSQL